MPSTAAQWISALGLQPHPEGGFYRELYRAEGEISPSALPARYDGARSYATSIYFLLSGRQVSHWHRLASDEIWYYHAGDGLTVHIIDSNGVYSSQRLGSEPDKGMALQVVIPHGCWFGATVDDPEGYCLVGCAVAPGFSFADFELASSHDILIRDEAHREIIERLMP